MVRIAGYAEPQSAGTASMEPCLFRHGKTSILQPHLLSVTASMEPCLFRHGKLPKGRRRDDDEHDASMEPCLFRHGKYIDLRNNKARVVASMEPCLFRHGKPGKAGDQDIRLPASMEPCLFRHGKSLPDMWLQLQGATMLQWSHVFSDMVSGRRRRDDDEHDGFNGAMSFQTW